VSKNNRRRKEKREGEMKKRGKESEGKRKHRGKEKRR